MRALILMMTLTVNHSFGQNYSSQVYPGANGNLEYASDAKGNRIPDFSIAGYKGGGVAIPDAPVVRTLEPIVGDNRQHIQDAIDWVAANIPLDGNGIRGAILLKAGLYEVSARIIINDSGIVIRGEGNCGSGTIIKHIGTDDRTFNIGGGSLSTNLETEVDQDYVPVGGATFKVMNTQNLSVGQEIVIKLTPTQKWVDDLQYTGAWQPIDLVINWNRTITAVDYVTDMITINVGITSQIDIGNAYGNAEIYVVTGDGLTNNVGIEDLILMSDYDRTVTDSNGRYIDENHARVGINFGLGRDNWARRVTGYFYWFGLVQNFRLSSNITVEDCAMLDGVSTDTPTKHAGTRDYYFTADGKGGLFQRCYGRYARHTFIMNGPRSSNVFLDCYAEKEHLSSEPHQRWTTGSMYDNVRTDAQFKLNRYDGAGGSHGQRAANCMLWNITSDNKRHFEPDIYLDKPALDLGKQWAIGIINNGTGQGIATPSPESNFSDATFVESVGSFVEPRSLYLAQLKDRLGQTAVDNIVSPEQNISAQAVWDQMIAKYQSIPEFGDPDNLSWLPLCDDDPDDDQSEVKLSASADAFVQGGVNENTNFGTTPFMIIKNSSNSAVLGGYDRRSFLKFDLSGIASNVATAKIRLRVKGINSTSAFHNLDFVSDDSWSETGITGNNMPTTASLVNTAAVPATGEWIEFDVTTEVNTERNGDGVISVRISESTIGTFMTYYSKEDLNPDNQPQLVYELIEEDLPILSASADAFVQGGVNENTNFGTTPFMIIKNNSSSAVLGGYDRRSFLKFDLSGIASNVATAKIRLRVKYINGTSAFHNLDFVSDDSWSETGITGNNMPSTASLVNTAAVPATGEWIEFDVTTEVNTERNGDGVISVRISESTIGTFMSYYSKEDLNVDNSPQLVYTISQGTGKINKSKISLNNDEVNEEKSTFRQYPNPVTGDKMTFEFSLTYSSEVNILIFDIRGALVEKISKKFGSGNNRIDMSTSNFKSNGLYIYKIVTNEYIENGKLIYSKK